MSKKKKRQAAKKEAVLGSLGNEGTYERTENGWSNQALVEQMPEHMPEAEERILPSLADNYDAGDQIARGANGRVVRYSDRNGGDDIAVKHATDAPLERDVMEQVGEHENMVKQVAQTEGTSIALEMLTGGTATSVIDNLRAAYEANDISHTEYWGAIQAMTGDASAGLAHMHDNGMVHRDFKPDNMMFDESGTGKLVDFGSALDVGADVPGYIGSSPENLAPEAVHASMGSGPLQASTEIDSMGLAQMVHLAGEGEFADTSSGDGLLHMLQTRGASDMDESWCGGQSGAYGDYLNKMSANDKDARMTAGEGLTHDFLLDPMLPEDEGREVLARMANYEAPEAQPELSEAEQKRANKDRKKAQKRQNKADKLSTKDAVAVARGGERESKAERRGRRGLLAEIQGFDQRQLQGVDTEYIEEERSANIDEWDAEYSHMLGHVRG